MNILIVDDSMVSRRISRRAIQEKRPRSDRFFEAANGQEALTLLFENTVGLIIVDWNMPELDGFEFVKRVRQKEKYVNLPIIMVTAERHRENVLEAMKTGVTNYLVKPITSDVLWQKIAKHFEEA